MKGILALDIDGTITAEHNAIASEVIHFLTALSKEGWQIIFITGRPFKWGYEVLQHLHFSYYFAVQNGAIILQMPSRAICSKKTLDTSIIPGMEAICGDEPSDFVVYAGYEYDDACYYRPDHFKGPLKQYVENRSKSLEERWVALDSFAQLPVKEFLSVKCFGDYDSAFRIATRMEAELQLHTPLIRDPFQEGIYVAQGTHAEVTKGYAVKDFKRIVGQGFVIAAGDDLNDLSMLQAADIKVVMESAPDLLRSIADIIAPPAARLGIIAGLTEAINLRRF